MGYLVKGIVMDNREDMKALLDEKKIREPRLVDSGEELALVYLDEEGMLHNNIEDKEGIVFPEKGPLKIYEVPKDNMNNAFDNLEYRMTQLESKIEGLRAGIAQVVWYEQNFNNNINNLKENLGELEKLCAKSGKFDKDMLIMLKNIIVFLAKSGEYLAIEKSISISEAIKDLKE